MTFFQSLLPDFRTPVDKATETISKLLIGKGLTTIAVLNELEGKETYRRKHDTVAVVQRDNDSVSVEFGQNQGSIRFSCDSVSKNMRMGINTGEFSEDITLDTCKNWGDQARIITNVINLFTDENTHNISKSDLGIAIAIPQPKGAK